MNINMHAEVNPQARLGLTRIITVVVQKHTKQLTADDFSYRVEPYSAGSTIDGSYFGPGLCYKITAVTKDNPKLALYLAAEDDLDWRVQSVKPVSTPPVRRLGTRLWSMTRGI